MGSVPSAISSGTVLPLVCVYCCSFSRSVGKSCHGTTHTCT